VNIVHISTSDDGGAGLCALRIHEALLKASMNSKMLCKYKTSGAPEVYTCLPIKKNTFQKILFKIGLRSKREKIELRIKEIAKKIPDVFYSSPFSKYDLAEHPLVKNADIIHLHWIAGFLDYPSFFSKCKDKKIIWTVHDENIFFGGFHY